MYKRDKIIAVLLFLIAGIITYSFGFDYSKISSTVFTVVSISVAVYIAVAVALLDSRYAVALKSAIDTKITTKTQLGILSEYLRWAGRFSIITIVISCFFIVLPSEKTMMIMQQLIKQANVIEAVGRLASSIAFGVFALNILFLWRIFIFLINSLNKAA